MTKSVLGHVPCQKDKLHQYIIAAWSPFRLRCSTYKCRDNLNAGNAFRWFATLIVQGHVPRTSVGLPADMSTDVDTRVDIGLDRLRVSPTFDLAVLPKVVKKTKAPKRVRFVQVDTPPQGPFHVQRTVHTPGLDTPKNTLSNIPRTQVTQIQADHFIGFHTNWTPPDGNCMFHAIARAMGMGPSGHVQLRKDSIKWIRDHKDKYMPFVLQDVHVHGHNQAFNNYLSVMAQQGEWGDHPVLQALCDCKSLRMSILQKWTNGTFTWTHLGKPSNNVDRQKVFWLYLTDHHYENLLSIRQLSNL
jgi:hypothetical protein